MRVTVCELPDDQRAFEPAWEALVAYVREQRSELVLLPELPFYPWIGRSAQFHAQVWQKAQEGHDAGMKRLPELGSAIVLGTHMLMEGEQRLNRGFYWTLTEGYHGVHDKYYLPNEEGFYERCWFDRGQHDFRLAQVGEMAIGFLICSELMMNEWARYYGRQGANIIAVPRATGGHERWMVATRMAAIASGAFVISSNRAEDDLFGGRGLVIGPDGDVLAITSRQAPFATVNIDLEESVRAKKTYPRDLLE
ncbi:MAG TPA: carbon-nitrogen hydrolase family protein [Ktedonosporobacter sp.]|nr:carbon-nitrogen hydrolase family protein [Ktedonosporobacter sp.]